MKQSSLLVQLSFFESKKFCVQVFPGRHDTQHNDTQQNDTRNNGLICDTQHKLHSEQTTLA